MKDKIQEIFHLLPRLLKLSNSKSGFTLPEVLLVAFILGMLFTALFQTLNVGQIANIMSSERVALQSYVRRALNWVTNDVRATNLQQIDRNNPSVNHIKFQKVTGINETDPAAPYTVNSTTYIEYSYSSATSQLTRNELSTADNSTLYRDGRPLIWVFNNITQSPFYTNVTSTPWVPLVSTPGDDGSIIKAKKLIIVIAGQRQARNSLLNLTLTEEVKIRNE